MDYTKKQIMSGVSTLRKLRTDSLKGEISMMTATNLHNPYNKSHWRKALSNLEVIKLNEFGYLDQYYWNQKKFKNDHELCIAVYDETKNIYENIKKSIKTRKEKEKEKQTYHIEFDHLKITKEEFQKLVDIYGETDVLDIIARIKNYKSNKKYKSLYLTAHQWLRSSWNRDSNNKNEGSIIYKEIFQHKINEQNMEASKEKMKAEIKVEKVQSKTKWLKILGIKIYEKSID